MFPNSNVFGSCIIHILYTECAKIKKIIIPAPKRLKIIVLVTRILLNLGGNWFRSPITILTLSDCRFSLKLEDTALFSPLYFRINSSCVQ